LVYSWLGSSSVKSPWVGTKVLGCQPTDIQHIIFTCAAIWLCLRHALWDWIQLPIIHTQTPALAWECWNYVYQRRWNSASVSEAFVLLSNHSVALGFLNCSSV
jgi:hypothetical protein